MNFARTASTAHNAKHLQEVNGGADMPYAEAYRTEGLQHPLYQLMASGMTDSTARKVTCNDWRKDVAGLRHALPMLRWHQP